MQLRAIFNESSLEAEKFKQFRDSILNSLSISLILYTVPRIDPDGFCPRSSGYNEVSIDNRSALCDKNSDDTEGPLEPGPLI